MKKPLALALLLALTACQHQGMDRYSYQDVGKPSQVVWGTVVSHRPVRIEGQNHGVGAVAGGLGGALGGAYVGNGGGQLAAMLVGAVAAGIAGQMAEQAVSDYDGIEYTITLSNSETITVTQTAEEANARIKDGDRVMIQSSGTYARVLPAEHLPAKVKKAKKIEVE